MGLKDMIPGAKRLQAGVDAVTGAPWAYTAHETSKLKPNDVKGLEEWMLVRPHDGLLAVHHKILKVTKVVASSRDLRKSGDSFTIHCQNPIVGHGAEVQTLFELQRDRDKERSVYNFTSNNATNLHILGTDSDFPITIDGTLAFNYVPATSGISLHVEAHVPEGNSARLVHSGIAARGIDPVKVTKEVVENILVAFGTTR